MYTKVCAGMLDTMVRQEPGDKKWQLVLPGCSAVDCSYVWLQARCVALEPAGPARKHDTATLDDGTGRVLVLTEKGSSRVVPEKYYMVLGKLLRSAAYGDLWIIRPHKLVGLFRACVLRLKCTAHQKYNAVQTDLTDSKYQRTELWKVELQEAYPAAEPAR